MNTKRPAFPLIDDEFDAMNLQDKSGQTYREAYYRARTAVFRNCSTGIPQEYMTGSPDSALGWRNGIKDAKAEMRLDTDTEWD
jgi:hypothetical protein